MNLYENLLTKNLKKSQKTAMQIIHDNGGMREYTYAQLFDYANMLADSLERVGIRPGDRVAIVAENCPEWCAAFLAVAKLRATSVLIDVALEDKEIWKMLDKSKLKCIFTTPKILDKLGLFSNIPVLNIFDKANVFDGYDCKVSNMPTIKGDENVATIIFSSGTSKEASGIMHSHESLLGSAEMTVKSVKVTSCDRSLAVVPNSHIYGLTCQIVVPLYLGATTCFLENLNGDMINKAFGEFQPTFLPAVPKMYELLKTQIMRKINSDKKKQALFNKLFPECLALRTNMGINAGKVFFKEIHKGFGSKMKFLASAGAPLNIDTAEFFYGIGFDVLITYGATETNTPTIGNYGKKLTTDTCGRAYPDVSVRISESGEILVKSPYMMIGYFDDEEATSAAYDENGWFKTGDLGSIEVETGYITVLGRCKDNIILATGKKVSPEEIEAAYSDFENVKELVVCGIPVSEGGYDEIHAFVVAEPKKIKEVTEHLKEKSASLPHNLKLSDIHIVDEIPKTSLQKPKRYLLREIVKQSKATEILPATQNNNAETDIEMIVKKSVADIAKVNVSDVSAQTKLFSELSIDSLSSIELVCELEEKCGISVDINCLSKDMTVADLTAYISTANGDAKNSVSHAPDYPMKKNKQDYGLFRFIQTIFGRIYKIKIENDTVLPNNSGYIICSNHVSNFDYLFLTLNFKWERFSKFCCMAKKELFNKKTLSFVLAKIAGMIPVDRNGFANGAFSIVRDKLKENWGVLIHPEGTRSNDGELSGFKKGAALLSIEANVPIVPAYIDGGYEVYPKSKKLPNLFNWKKMKKYRVKIKYGEPIFPKNLTADELIKAVESAVIQLKYGVIAATV